MKLIERIDSEIKNAMYSKDKILLTTVRAIKAEITELEKSKETKGIVSEEAELAVIRKMIKKRKESAAIYASQNRPDLEKAELLEVNILIKYLPEDYTDAELRKEILILIGQTGVSRIEQIGLLTKEAMNKLRGRADGKRISEQIKILFPAYLKTLK